MDEYDLNYWYGKLQRHLSKKEKQIIKSAGHEYCMNIEVADIQGRINKIGFKISNLSRLIGYCLYESVGFNTGENCKIIKKKIQQFMIKNKNLPVVNGNDMPLQELCEIYNEIEFVKLNGVKTKYTFELMTLDILQKGGHQRINTEILLNILSRMYNKKIIVFRNKNAKGECHFH